MTVQTTGEHEVSFPSLESALTHLDPFQPRPATLARSNPMPARFVANALRRFQGSYQKERK
jgi:hypothetical protein